MVTPTRSRRKNMRPFIHSVRNAATEASLGSAAITSGVSTAASFSHGTAEMYQSATTG